MREGTRYSFERQGRPLLSGAAPALVRWLTDGVPLVNILTAMEVAANRRRTDAPDGLWRGASAELSDHPTARSGQRSADALDPAV